MARTVIDAESVARVLSELADIASETLELQEVFDRVATSIRAVIPFDNIGVVRILDGERVVLHAATVRCADPDRKCFEPMPVTHWSPRWRPHAGPMRRIDDARSELDPSFPMDAMVLAGGMASGLWEPFRRGNSFAGGVWVCSETAYSYDDAHQEVLRPIAALLGSAVEHWHMLDAERRRRERLERVESLLGTLAESLDVREVFEDLSRQMKPILTHDMMVLTELDTRESTHRN